MYLCFEFFYVSLDAYINRMLWFMKIIKGKKRKEVKEVERKNYMIF